MFFLFSFCLALLPVGQDQIQRSSAYYSLCLHIGMHTHITSGWKNTSEEKSINIVVSLENLFSSILVEIHKPRKKMNIMIKN
jgi:hypothetical protein